MSSSARRTRPIAAFVLVASLALSPAASAAGVAGRGEARDARIVTSARGVEELCNVTHPIAQEAPPFGIGPCPGVRPGAEVWSDTGGCTFNFMFRGYVRDELTGELVEAGRFMGTAGHCIVVQSEQQHVWAAGTGPEARDGNDRRIGEFAFAVNSSTKDFALIRLDPEIQANPAMCHFGGPTGMHDPSLSPVAPRVIQHFGQGIVFGDTVSARSGAGYLSDPNWTFAGTGASFGDSGSGVEMDDGRAIGVLVAISPLGVVITRLAPRVEDARKALALETLEIQTAPEVP
jgi:hypothetical protein